MGEWPNFAVGADDGVLAHAIRFDFCTCAHHDVVENNTLGDAGTTADAGPATQRNTPSDLGDADILEKGEILLEKTPGEILDSGKRVLLRSHYGDLGRNISFCTSYRITKS